MSNSMSNKLKLYQAYLDRGAWDNALFLAYEINPMRFESEFIMPSINNILNQSDALPLKTIALWFEGMNCNWSYQDNPSRARPRYTLIKSSEHWDFQTLLERIYSRKIKSVSLSSRRILTKTSFIKEFGNDLDFSKRYSTSNLTSIEIEELRSIGVIGFAEKKIDFMKAVKAQIETRLLSNNTSELDDWI